MQLSHSGFASEPETSSLNSKTVERRATPSSLIEEELPWPWVAVLAYRCFLVVFWTLLVLLFALVIYNTVVGTSPTSSAPPYSYPRSP
jgi:hypothetical protein